MEYTILNTTDLKQLLTVVYSFFVKEAKILKPEKYRKMENHTHTHLYTVGVS